MSKKLTVREVVKAAGKNKPVNVRQITQFAKEECPELGITDKSINEYLYSESYGSCTLYESCEAFSKIK